MRSFVLTALIAATINVHAAGITAGMRYLPADENSWFALQSPESGLCYKAVMVTDRAANTGYMGMTNVSCSEINRYQSRQFAWFYIKDPVSRECHEVAIASMKAEQMGFMGMGTEVSCP